MGVMIITALICFVIIPLVVNYTFRTEAPVDILAARWNASDALIYISAILAFLGTLFLGLVSWKQNTDLQTMERNNFIANNSCEVFLDTITLKDMGMIACNLDTEHAESIVAEKGIQGSNYGSIKLVVSLKRTKGCASLVKVNDLQIFIGNKNEGCVPIWAYAYDETYNRMAISKDHNAFEITVLLKPETKKKILEKLNSDCTISMDIAMDLSTPSYVVTKIKCRGNFKRTESAELVDSFEIAGVEPMCFWNGNYISTEQDIKFRVPHL